MPTYEYACTACGHRLDAVQKFSDDPLTECPECGGALRKVYGAVGIVLKGSGFYKTDSRAAAGTGKNGKGSRSSEAASSGDSSGSDNSGSGASEKKDSAGSDGGTKSDGSGKDSKPATAAAK